MKKLSIGFVFFCAALLLTLTAAPIAAQGSDMTPSGLVKSEVTTTKQDVRPQWGAEYTIAKPVSAFDCPPFKNSTTYDVAYTQGSLRYCTGTYCWFACPVDLPSGAQITELEIDGCDSSATNQIYAKLFKNAWNGGTTSIVEVSSGLSATPGCSYWWNTPSTPETIDNWNTYIVEVSLGENDIATSFKAVVIYYKLQISPAPGTASFNDVPTSHPFFQEIEAMYASGITQGCPYPNFCPNNYVTRQEMAAFFARALGLNWYH